MEVKNAKLAIDIGGTFTDFVLSDDVAENGFHVQKTLTTPSDPSIAVLEGATTLLERTGMRWRDLATVNHATTLVTNAVIERKGVRTGLLTTQGMRDTLLIGTERRYDIYDIFLDLPAPLVPRHLVQEISERMLVDGTVLQPLDVDQASTAIAALLAHDPKAIGVCLLHSYANPTHEKMLRDLITEVAPEISVSLSSEILPEMREYFRATTTVVNAYVQPIVQRYVERLQTAMQSAGMDRQFYLMQSNGGTCDVKSAVEQPVRLLESGPAAGALAAAFFGNLASVEDLLSFDMGGTTAKLCLVERGQPLKTTFIEAARIHRFKPGSGLPVKIPVIELIEIGAGGGSIASIDTLSLLKVGPESAGADPGPACYDLGGVDPTVSDADLLLGYLNPDFFLGGNMKLDVGKAEAAVHASIAEPAGISTIEAAAGIHRVVNEQMALAAKMHIIEKGQDPRRYAMVAFGGAGPVHAYGVARVLKLSRIIYPIGAGAASAVGLLIAPIAFDLMRTLKVSIVDADMLSIDRAYAELEAEGKKLLRDAGVVEEAMAFTRSADMRYRGQGYEVEVPLPDGNWSADTVEAIQQRFNEVYLELYGRLTPDVPVEFVTLRLVGAGPKPDFPMKPKPPGDPSTDAARKGERQVYFSELGDFMDVPVFDRYLLTAQTTFPGPAIVEERESTVVIGPDASCRIDDYGNLVVDLVYPTVEGKPGEVEPNVRN